MAEKILQTRILNKIDSLENWEKSTLALKKGELAFVVIEPTAENGLQEAVVMVKIGEDGVKTFNDLSWNFYAKASDVIAAAKSEDTLRAFINGVITDAGVATDDALKTLSTQVTTNKNDIATLKGDANTAGSIAKAIADAIAAIDLSNTYAAKEHDHEIDDVNGLADSIADAKQAGTDAANALDTYKGEMTTALAGKQDVIPENTYDAHGAADQALTDAKAYVDAEDKFEIDMVTVNAHGGIAAGEDLNGLTTHEILKKILYPYVQPTLGNATASPNGGTYEKGVTKTITQVSISVTKKSELITSVALYNGSTLVEEKTGDAVKNGGTITFSNLNIVVPTDGNQLTVKVTDAKGNVQEKKTTAMSFVYPYYMGTCAAGTVVDETLVESLTKKIEGKGNKSNSFTVSDGNMVFAYPKAHGVLKSILDPNNFETIGNYTRSEVSVTGLDGTAQTYYVYVSGATTVSGFVVNFKY